MTNRPRSRKANIVVQELETEVLIYDLSINKAFCLNETSSLVFQLSDGTKSVAEISDFMSKKLKTLVSEDLIWLTLNELKKENLLENSEELSNHFAGLTRREIIKRVGLASLVALPVIASVVAPSAVMAQSGAMLLAFNSACTSNGQCASGNCTTGTMICCAPGVNPFSNSTPVCGFCPTIDFCCSGMIIDQGAAPCGGAGNFCFCQLS